MAEEKKDKGKKQKAANRLADARAQMYHDLVFQSAESVFGKKGYDGSTMQDIADEAGVSLKTVYGAFSSKEDLYAEIMRERTTRFIAGISAALAGEGDPWERISRGTHAYVEFLFQHRDWLSMHLRSRVAWSFRPSNEDAARAWKDGHDLFGSVLQEGIDSGQFHPGDSREMAITSQAVMQVQLALAVERREENPEAASGAILVQLRRLLCTDEAA